MTGRIKVYRNTVEPKETKEIKEPRRNRKHWSHVINC
jgi:hypothetical protein